MDGLLRSLRAALRVAGVLAREMVADARRVRPGRLPRAVRITVIQITPLLIGHAAGHVEWGVAASWGAFAGFYGHDRPYRERSRLIAVMALAFLCATLAGRLASHSGLALVLVGSAWAAIATGFARSLQLEPPREYMLILIMLLVASLPRQPVTTPELIPCVLAGGAWAWLVQMTGALRDREAPERRSVAAGLRGVLGLLEHHGRGFGAARHQAVLAVRGGRRAVEVAGGPSAPRLRRVQLAAEDLLDAALALPRLPADGADAEAFAAGARGELAARVRALLEELRAPLEADPPGARPPWRRLLLGWPAPAEVFSRRSLVPPTAARVGAAVLAGLTIGVLADAQRAYWIAVTAAAVMQGVTMQVSARRAIDRATGTAAGLLIGFAIVWAEPPTLGIIAAAAIVTFLAESTILASYAVGITFVTPLVLLLGEVAAPGILTDGLVVWRLVDTVIGCALGLVAGRVLWPGSARFRLDAQLQAVLDEVTAVLASEPGTPERRGHRQALRRELVDLRAISDAGLGDRLTRAPGDDARWPVVAATEQLGYRALDERTARRADLETELGRVTAFVARSGDGPTGSAS